MSIPFNQEKSNIVNDLTILEALILLSSDQEDILNHVFNLYQDEQLVEQGALIRHDMFESEPFFTDDVEKIVKLGLLSKHEDSDQLNAFLTMNKDVADAAVDYGICEYLD